MTSSIVFTFIGADKPGLIETLSNTVSEYKGNWLESRMSQLAGLFAGIARVQISSTAANELVAALEQLNSQGINVVVQTCDSHRSNTDYTRHELSLIGNDRPNIVRELSSALTKHHINVCEMNTDVTSAPMTAEPLFKANALIQVPTTIDINQLNDELDAIADELDIDINLEN